MQQTNDAPGSNNAVTGDNTGRRIRQAGISILFVSAFGPYIMGIRTDLVAAVLVTYVGFLLWLIRPTPIPRRGLAFMIVLLVAAFMVIFADAAIAPATRMASYWNSAARLLVPAFVSFCLLVLGPPDRRERYGYYELVLVLAFAGALVALASRAGANSLLTRFYARGGDAGIWNQALSLGRYSGIFNQPLEAGVFYSIALLLAVLLWTTGSMGTIRSVAYMAGIYCGGALSMSKMFIIVGVVCSVLLAVSIDRKKGCLYGLVVAAGAAAALIFFLGNGNSVFLESYKTMARDGNILNALTAGRLGDDQNLVQRMTKDVLSLSPVFGFGLGTRLPLDSGYLEYLYQGGVPAFACYLLVFAMAAVPAWKNRRDPEARLLLSVVAFALVASLGGPFLTANRAGIFCVFVIHTIVAALPERRAAATPEKTQDTQSRDDGGKR